MTGARNWRKAKYSKAYGDCVEVSGGGGTVAMRDSKDREGAVLAVPADAWRAFTRRVRS